MEFILHKNQGEVASDLHRFRVLCCGRRWGKTTLAIDQMKACAIAKPTRIAYIAPTLQQARDIAWEQLKRDCAQAALSIREAPRLEIILPTQRGGESLIVLRGWEAIETLRGQAFDLIVIDEVASMKNFWTNWQEVIRPTLTDKKGEVLFISTPKGFNHFYDLYNLQDEDTDYKSWHFPSSDNPFLPPEEIKKAEEELTPERFAQEYMADFKKTAGLVFKEFDRAIHVFKYFPEDARVQEIIAGVDFGFESPAAVPEIWIDSTDCWWIRSEYYETHKTDMQVAEFVAAKNYAAVYPDPEAAGAIQEMRKKRINVRDVVKGKDSIENGINFVRERLLAQKLKVHVSCKNTIMEFETYAYPDKKDDKSAPELPIDEFNHMMDAIRYPVMMRAKRNAKAAVYYPQSTMPRDNLNPVSEKPRIATTYVPRL